MKKYQKNCLFVGFVLISFSIISITFLFAIPLKQSIKFEENNHISKKQTEQTEQTEYKYVVKELCGKIAVFESGKDMPFETINTQIEYLPEYDQKILKDGIYIEDIEKLNKVLEDYEH